MKFIYRLLGITSLILLSACVSNEVKRDPAYAAVRPVATAPVERNDGAIFDTRTNITLFEDYKARRVGDILTVRLQERTDAEKESTTTVDKTSSNNINNPTIFGTTPNSVSPVDSLWRIRMIIILRLAPAPIAVLKGKVKVNRTTS